MVKYEMVVEYTHLDLNRRVNDLLFNGYELYGSPFSVTSSASGYSRFGQAMILKQNSSEG